MIDDISDELLGGFWPFLKRVLVLFMPIWVYFLGVTAGLPLILSSILAGSSLALIIVFEKYKLSQENPQNEDR
tara:strand:+ start:2195 stop:2413 length:219 start_codon:yes stop_codon:yes gene_type:complete